MEGMVRKRPCSICRRWFMPDVRVGQRQQACSSPDCQAARRIAERAKKEDETRPALPPPPPRTAPPLDRLPWDVAQDQFGVQGADFLWLFGRVLLRAGQDQRRAQPMDTS
jgi:hypothetical protein